MGLSPAAVLVNTSGGIQQVAPATSLNSSWNYASGSSNTFPGNTNRAGMSLLNDSTGTVLVRLGTTVSSTVYSFYLQPGQSYESGFPGWTGPVAVLGYNAGAGTVFLEEMFP